MYSYSLPEYQIPAIMHLTNNTLWVDKNSFWHTHKIPQIRKQNNIYISPYLPTVHWWSMAEKWNKPPKRTAIISGNNTTMHFTLPTLSRKIFFWRTQAKITQTVCTGITKVLAKDCFLFNPEYIARICGTSDTMYLWLRSFELARDNLECNQKEIQSHYPKIMDYFFPTSHPSTWWPQYLYSTPIPIFHIR